MRLFDYEKGKLILSKPEILLVKEFKQVYDSDKSKGKELAFKYFAYLYLTKDWSSPYRNFTEQQRKEAAMKDTGLSEKEVTQDFILEAQNYYQDILDSNPVISLIKDMKMAMNNLKHYFRTVNFTEKIDSGAKKGQLLYEPKELISVMKDADMIIDKVKALEKRAKDEIIEQETKYRGGNDDISPLDS